MISKVRNSDPLTYISKFRDQNRYFFVIISLFFSKLLFHEQNRCFSQSHRLTNNKQYITNYNHNNYNTPQIDCFV